LLRPYGARNDGNFKSRMIIKKNKGIALIAAIMLIVFVSIAVLGLSVFIVQWFKQIDVRARESRCIYNAYAGINYAIWNYKSNPSVLTNGTISIDANNNFTVSTVPSGGGAGEAANLTINATGSGIDNKNKDIVGITLTNTSLTSSITLSQMIIYIDSGTKTLDKVRIHNSNVWSDKTSISTTPLTLNMDDVVIPPNTTRTVQYIRWKDDISADTVYWGFIMSDGTTASACQVYPASSSCGSSLNIKSMGKTAGSNQYRSVEATYNTILGNVTVYDEIFQTVP